MSRDLVARCQLIGTSHVEAVRQAAQGVALDIVNIDQVPELKVDDKLVFIGPLKDVPDAVFLAIGGVLHTILGLVEDPKPFSVGDTAQGQVPLGDRWFIPENTMRDFFRIKQEHRYTLMRSCIERYSAGATVAVLAPPPPRGRIEQLDRPGRFAKILERGFAPPELRRKLYQLEIDVLRDFCEEMEIGFIGAPEESMDDGYLREHLHAGDPTHANAAYGALIVNQIRTFVTNAGMVLGAVPENKMVGDV